jgi:hypothetical protein
LCVGRGGGCSYSNMIGKRDRERRRERVMVGGRERWGSKN